MRCFLKSIAEIPDRSLSDTLDLAAGSSGLIRYPHPPVRPTPRQLDNGMDFIDKQDAVGILLKLFSATP